MTANSPSFILAADVGGTKTNIALFDPSLPGTLSARLLRRASFVSAAYAGLGELVAAFLNEDKAVCAIGAACFGIPGPVVDGTCEVSNLPWRVDAAELARRFSIPSVSLLNDLEATAHAVAALDDGAFRRLSAAARAEPGRPQAVIAAGTGLGMALLAPDATGFRPLASEGGHVDFAPRDELEIDLLRALQKDYGHVSVERILSGPGLARLYEFFCERPGVRVNSAVRTAVRSDPAEAPARVSSAALGAECEAAVLALDLFVRQYGAVAGNLGLTTYATGGLYLAGGIAPKILPQLERGGFMQAFNDKGRLRSLTERIPVYVILDEQAPLLGAAHQAARSR